MVKGKRYELSDEGWERLVAVLPVQKRGGRWNDHRLMLNGIFWVLNSGAPWRDVSERYGHWKTTMDAIDAGHAKDCLTTSSRGCISSSMQRVVSTGASSRWTALTSAQLLSEA